MNIFSSPVFQNSRATKGADNPRKVKMKRFSSLFVSTALLLSVFSFIKAAAAVAVAPSPPSQRSVAAAVRFAPRQIKESNRKLRYTITAKYPQAVGRDPRFERLNQAIRSLMTEQISDFKKDFEAPEERMGPAGSTFDVGYTVKLSTADLVSIIFYIDSYYEGAAHPNHATVSFNYSFETQKTMTLAELFRGNNYLKVISAYAIKDLKKQLGPDPDSEWIQKGAGPEEENYKSWSITRRGLLITFDQYQVASYAEGPHEVIIPYNVLRSVIDPAGPLSKIRT